MNSEVDQDELGEKCDFDRCHCVPAGNSAVAEDKTVYCSVGCQEGRGCDCEPCNCANSN